MTNDASIDFDGLLEDLPEDQAQQLRDTAALVLAGLDQAREHLGMTWQMCSWKRMKALSERVAVETVDWTKYDGLLVGTWMASSCRSQIAIDQESE